MKFNKKLIIIIKWNVFWNVVSKIAVILYTVQCVKRHWTFISQEAFEMYYITVLKLVLEFSSQISHECNNGYPGVIGHQAISSCTIGLDKGSTLELKPQIYDSTPEGRAAEGGTPEGRAVSVTRELDLSLLCRISLFGRHLVSLAKIAEVWPPFF